MILLLLPVFLEDEENKKRKGRKRNTNRPHLDTEQHDDIPYFPQLEVFSDVQVKNLSYATDFVAMSRL